MNSCEFVVGAERNKRHFDYRYGCRVWPEPLAQYRQIRQPAPIKFYVDQHCQLGFAAAIVGKRQQLDRQLARTPVTDFLLQYFRGNN